MAKSLGFEATREELGNFIDEHSYIASTASQNFITDLTSLNVKFESIDDTISTLNQQLITLKTRVDNQASTSELEATISNLMQDYQSVANGIGAYQTQIIN